MQEGLIWPPLHILCLDGGRTFEDSHPDDSSVLSVPDRDRDCVVIVVVIVIVIVIVIAIVVGNLATDLAVPEQTMVSTTNTNVATPFF